MEELKKNFILLSTVAREKKYAQEYFGLLARRGDLGSIRIGKRWYTTQEWVKEFQSDCEKRKEELKKNAAQAEIAFVESHAAEQEEKIIVSSYSKSVPSADSRVSLDISNATVVPKVQAQSSARVRLNVLSQAGRSHSIRNTDAATSRSPGTVKIRMARSISEKNFKSENVPVPQMNIEALPQSKNQKIFMPPVFSKPAFVSRNTVVNARVKRGKSNSAAHSFARGDRREEKIPEGMFYPDRTHNFSPSFLQEKRSFFSGFEKLALGLSMVVLLAMLLEAGWFFKDDIRKLAGLESGIVAGAADSKVLENSDTVSSSAEYLDRQANKIKENVSVLRVHIRAAVERSAEQAADNK